MKKVMATTVFIICSLIIVSAKDFTLSYDDSVSGEIILDIALSDPAIIYENKKGQTFSVINFNGSSVTDKKGYVELPVINTTFAINGDTSITVINSTYTDYPLRRPLLPSKGVIYRSQRPSDIPYHIDRDSLTDTWYPGPLYKANKPFIFRDVKGVTITVYPFQYNARKNILRVYKTIRLKLTDDTPVPTRSFIPRMHVMDGMYRSLFFNYKSQSGFDAGTRSGLPINELGDILVLYPAKYAAAILPYIEWKTQKGYRIIAHEVPEGSNVKNTIKEAYMGNPDILYVQLVGDWADIKSDIGPEDAPTDPALGCVAGYDDYPELIIGRFSGDTPAEVLTQVMKAINYEKHPDLNGDWYAKGLGIASDEGVNDGDDGERDYEHMDIIKQYKLLPFDYTTIYDAYKSPETSYITDVINSGMGIINYAGHGLQTGWLTGNYDNSALSTLGNENMLPFIISVACVNGAFHQVGDSFAEAWLNQSNGGAVATIMSTIDQPWRPPMMGQDYANDILSGGYDYSVNPGAGISSFEQRTTFGAIMLNATMLMYTEDNTPAALDTMQTWTIFGDAALQVRTAKPQLIHVSNLIVNNDQPFTTKISNAGKPVAGSIVSLSRGGDVYSAMSDATGNVTVNHAFQEGWVTLTVTGFNLETQIFKLPVTDSSTTTGVVTNVAVNKPVYSSSNYSPEFLVKNANDGIPTTVWGSNTDDTPQWIYIDLLRRTHVEKLIVRWFDKFFPKKYHVAISHDGKNWTFVHDIVKEQSGADIFTGGATVRYIGIYCTEKNDIAYGLSEFEIYGVELAQ